MGIKIDAKRVVGVASMVISVIAWLINRSLKKDNYEPVMHDMSDRSDRSPRSNVHQHDRLCSNQDPNPDSD